MLLVTLAFALPPTGRPGTLSVTDGALGKLLVSEDGALVAGIERADTGFWVVSTDTWTVHAAAPCSVTDVALAPFGDAHDVFVACTDGTLRWWEFADEQLQAVVDDDGAPVVFQLATEGLLGVWWDGATVDPLFYVLEDTDLVGTMHVVEPYTGLVDDEVWSGWSTLPQTAVDGLREGVVDVGVLTMVHDNNRSTLLNFATGALSYSPLNGGGLLLDTDDVAPGGGTKLWGLDTSLGTVFEFRPTLGTTILQLTGQDTATCLYANTDFDDDWLVVAGSGVRVFELESGLIADAANPVYAEDGALQIVDVVAGPDGYAFAGTSTGTLEVLTARPWVDQITVAPTTATTGDTLSVAFRLDSDADWAVHLNGDRTGSGAVLASGSSEGEDVTVSLTVQVGPSWIEGANKLYVVATSPQGQDGHARVDVTVDAPPEPPSLTDANVGFADGALTLSFEGIPDADLARYDVWVSDVPWTSEDYAVGEGGPPAVVGGPATPIAIPAEGGASVTLRIEPLQNGVTYYIGVRSYDAAGAESAMSQVIQGVPEQDFRASDLAGETGGGPCATGSWGAVGWLALGLAGVALRRRGSGVLAALLLAGPALAADDDDDRKEKRADRGDLTSQHGNFELRYGGFTQLADESIKEVYGPGGHNMLQVEFGPQLWRFFEVDAQLGFYQELANTVSDGGSTSSVKTMLTWYPLGVSATARLHVFDEQIVVPHARLGADYVLWNELTDNGDGGKDRLNGSKLGHHYAFGASLLLDVFAPGRASLLEAQTGVNDTYITVEWRRQNVDSRDLPWSPAEVDGFDFSGSMLTVGLKLDY